MGLRDQSTQTCFWMTQERHHIAVSIYHVDRHQNQNQCTYQCFPPEGLGWLVYPGELDIFFWKLAISPSKSQNLNQRSPRWALKLHIVSSTISYLGVQYPAHASNLVVVLSKSQGLGMIWMSNPQGLGMTTIPPLWGKTMTGAWST